MIHDINDPHLERRREYMPIRLKALKNLLLRLDTTPTATFREGGCPAGLSACSYCPGCHNRDHMTIIENLQSEYDSHKVKAVKELIENIEEWLNSFTTLDWPNEE